MNHYESGMWPPFEKEDITRPFCIGVHEDHQDGSIDGFSNLRMQFLRSSARFLQFEDVTLTIDEYPFLKEFGDTTVFNKVRELTLDGSRASIFDLCIELDCLPALQKQFLEKRPAHLDEGLLFVNDYGRNIVQQAVTRGQLTKAIDFITGLYPPDQEQEVEVPPILVELFFKLLANSDGYYRPNAVVMAAEAGCLHEMGAVVQDLLKWDRERVISIFDSGQEYRRFNGGQNILHLLLNNGIPEENTVATDLIIKVFAEDKDRLKRLLTEKNFYGQEPLATLFTEHPSSVVKILVAAYDGDPDGFKELIDSRNLISRLSSGREFRSSVFPLFEIYFDNDPKSVCEYLKKDPQFIPDLLDRASANDKDVLKIMRIIGDGELMLACLNRCSLTFPSDLILLEYLFETNAQELESFIRTGIFFHELDHHLMVDSRGITLEVLWKQTPNLLVALLLSQSNTPTSRLATAISNLLPKSEYADTSFQMGRGFLNGRFKTDTQWIEAIHLRESYIQVERGNSKLDRVRGDELLINLGPTEVEAMNAYDDELTRIRNSFEFLMKKVFGISGEFYSGDRDVFDPTRPDPKGVIARILNPRPLHGGGFAPDDTLFSDILKTLPLSPAGQQARHLVSGGTLSDDDRDKPFRRIFPCEEYPMLNKPEGGFLPIPISPEDWLEFIRRLCVHTPNLDTGSFLDFTIVRGSLNNKFLELAKGSGIDPDLQDISEIDKFSRMLASYYINAIYAMDRTRILNMEEVRQRPVYIRILDPKPGSRDFFDFFRFPYAGDPSERIQSNRSLEQTLKLYSDPEVAIAILYENRSAIDIAVEETSRDDFGLVEEESSAKMDAIEYKIDTFAFGYVTISTGSMRNSSEESLNPTDSEIIILGDAELAAYRSPENVAMVLLTLARELNAKTGFKVLISSAYGRVFEREIARGVTDISILPGDTLVMRHAKIEIRDNTGIKPKEMTRLYYSDEHPNEPTAMINNWFLIG